MWVVHKMLAYLWLTQKKRELTDRERDDMIHCLDANLNRIMKFSKLENMSLAASIIGDHSWQHEICKQIEELEV